VARKKLEPALALCVGCRRRFVQPGTRCRTCRGILHGLAGRPRAADRPERRARVELYRAQIERQAGGPEVPIEYLLPPSSVA
jgi:hypothetical protein